MTNTQLLEPFGIPPELAVSLTLPSDDLAPRQARAFTRNSLTEWNRHTERGLEQLADRALLVVSELVTNARCHGRTRPDAESEFLTLTLALREAAVLIGVGDNSDQLPVLHSGSPSDLDGRGLRLVDCQADAWASFPNPEGGGKRVVALLQRTLLRQHLDRASTAVLHEAPAPEAYGWSGGRAHEVVLPLKATRAPGWPPLPTPTAARLLSPAQMQTPAASSVLLAAVYGDLRRQDTLLAQYLPVLLERLGAPPWWYIRFRDPEQHLRLRIALSGHGAFAETAREVAAWAEELRAAGLVSDLRFPTSYREMGRWGSGSAWEAAEDVFRADSRAVLTQLHEPRRPQQRALVVAHTVAITSAFLGSVEAGTGWLIGHVPAAAPKPVIRKQFSEAVRLADPTDGWAALRAEPGGAAIVTGWAARDVALAGYRRHLPGPDTDGIALDDVLTSLLHTHFVRHVAVNFPEEELCLYLARAAALAWTGRTEKRKGARP